MKPDIFVLTTSSIRKDKWRKRHPSVKFIESDVLDENAILHILRSSLTKFFFVLRGNIKLADHFNLDFHPDSFDEQYLHVWNDEDMVRLFNRKETKKDISKYTDQSLRDGKVEIKLITDDSYEVETLDEVEPVEWEWYDTVEEGYEKCKDLFFFVKDPDVEVLEYFDRKYTPKVWHLKHVHHFACINPYTGNIVDTVGVYLYPTKVKDPTPIQVKTKACQFKPFDVLRVNDINNLDYELYDYESDNKFVYVVDKYLDIDMDYDYFPTQFDRDVLHIWRTNFGVPSVKLVPIGVKEYKFKEMLEPVGLLPDFDTFSSLEEGYAQSDELFFWVVPSDVELKPSFDKMFYVADDDNEYWWRDKEWDQEKISCFGVTKQDGSELNVDGVMLVPNDKEFSSRKYFDEYAGVLKKPDIVFLSHNEPFADINFEKVRNKYPRVKRVNGIDGIFNAHKAAAEIVDTEYFFLIDADAVLEDNFNIDAYSDIFDTYASDTVFVWRSINPVNGLEYGYGGVKCFPRKTLLAATEARIDFTTSLSSNFVPFNTVSNTTAFNTDPFNTWKSAFRECVKLSSKIIDKQKDKETEARLMQWCSVDYDSDFGEFALIGANMGKSYGEEHKFNQKKLEKINDFEWLREEFRKHVQDRV